MRKTRAFAWAIFPLLFFVATLSASSAPPAVSPTANGHAGSHVDLTRKRFRIGAVHGNILAWDPWTSSWTQVKAGTELWENTLVQLGHGANFSFEVVHPRNFKGVKSDSIEVTLNTPVVVRLDEDVMREVRLSSYFITAPPEQKRDPVAMFFKSLNEAWEKTAAVLSTHGVDLSFLALQKENAGDAAVALKARRIRIYTPPDDATLFADRLPTDLHVSWRRVPEPDVKYELRVWRADEPRPMYANALTTLDFHDIRINSEGSYFIQLASSDGRYQSGIHRLFIVLPIKGRIENKDLASGEKRPLPLLLPPDHFVYTAQSWPVWMSFQWEPMSPAPAHTTYEISITDAKGNELLKQKLAQRAFEVKFNTPGSYHWSVTASAPSSSPLVRPAHYTSETRTFDLVTAPPKVAQRGNASSYDRIAAMLASKSSGVLYLEEGL